MTEAGDDELCTTCRKPRTAHVNMRHAFTSIDGGEITVGKPQEAEKGPAPASSASGDSPRQMSPFSNADLILRSLLVAKGIVTPDELQDIEEHARHGILVVRERVAVTDSDAGDRGADHEDRPDGDAERGMRAPVPGADGNPAQQHLFRVDI